MKTNNVLCIAGAAAIVSLLAPPELMAQTGPSGSFTNTVSAAISPIWDLAGTVTNDSVNVTARNGTPITYSFPVSIKQNGRGQLSGSGPADVSGVFDSLSISFSGTYKVHGAVSSAHSGSRLRLNGSASGRAVILGKPRRVTAADNLNGIVDTGTLTISAQRKVVLRAVGRALTGRQMLTSVPLSTFGNLGNGSWTLTLDLASSGKHVTGTGVVVLNSAQTFSYNVKGRFNSTKNSSTLLLTGSDKATKGSTVMVSMSGNSVAAAKGRISGQLITAKF